MTKKRNFTVGGGAGDANEAPTKTVMQWSLAAVKCFEQYSVIVVLFFLVALGFYFMIKAPGYLQQNLEKYFFVLCLPLLLLFFVILHLDGNDTGGIAYKIAGTLVIGGALAWLYTQSNLSYFFSVGLRWTSIAVIVHVALAFVYGYIVSEMRRWRGWAGFVAQLLFFLPCLLRDSWQLLMEEFRLTSVSIYLALFLEVALIVFYLFLPQITQAVMGTASDSAIVLLNNPARLTDATELSGSSQLFDPVNATYRKNYAIGMWVYVTAHAQQMEGYHQETRIFSYGFTDSAGVQHMKPMIRYYGGGIETEATEMRNKFVMYVSEFPMASYDATLPLQRWNYIVFNYSHNEVNLFINAELKRTFHQVLPVYNELDTISVGDAKAGIQGGICNVVYYKHTLTPEQIAFSYNLLKDRDPPVTKVDPVAPASA